MIRMACVVLGTMLLSLSGQAQQASPMAWAFVLFGEGTDGRPVPMVRSVEESGTACPSLRDAGGMVLASMSPRRRPAGGHFDQVMVCEALYPVGRPANVQFANRRVDLPVVSLGTPRRIVMLGDSGCEGAAGLWPQLCAGNGYDKMWPFGTISSEGATDGPDLIIHLGDYNYRGTPHYIVFPTRATGYARDLRVGVFDTGDLDDEDEAPRYPIGPGYWSQNMEGSPLPDKWSSWRDDFFIPSARLLIAAPWLFSRGNHELCSRAGPGWFYLLDAASPLLGPGRSQAACPPQTPPHWIPGAWPSPPVLPFEGHLFPTQPNVPFRLRLGELDIIAIDSSDAGDAVLYALEHYVAVYRSVADLLAQSRTATWLVTHRPVWGVVRKIKGSPAGDAPYGFVNLTQQTAIATVFRDGLPAHVKGVFSGHMHRFQAVGFAGKRPPQLSVGTGGTELARVIPEPRPSAPKQAIRVPDLDGFDGHVVGLDDFGALVVTLGEGGTWTGTFRGTDNQPLASCDSRWATEAGDRSVCRLE
jgi:hypothetical protein